MTQKNRSLVYIVVYIGGRIQITISAVTQRNRNTNERYACLDIYS